MNPTSFLLKVWRIHCREGDYVALACKTDTWRDYCFPFDVHLEGRVADWISTHQGGDMYFCPLPFSRGRRSKSLVARSRLLWGDIDNADPYKVEPSILWESSPGRYQGLWLLPEEVTPEEAAEQSRKMAYYIGADRGGWDLTQVLRIPGTHNNKYKEKPEVKLIHFKSTILKSIPTSVLEKWRSTIPRKLIRIIEGPAEKGKRSDMLWYLEHELCDLGIPLKDVIAILRDSDWNKYRGRADEDERFEAEQEKIREDRQEKKTDTKIESQSLYVVDYAGVMSSIAGSPGWMVKDWWMRGSHGIIAGEPKSFKSTLAMDMLVSVAANRPFLDHPVEYGGPVLIVQNENSDWIMQDRLQKLSFSKGEVGNVRMHGHRIRVEWPRALPMFFINQQGFMLDDADNKQVLEDLIDRIRPVAVKLDPLYLMFGGDVNSAKDLSGVLQWCLYIKQQYNCAVILIHHYNKGGEGRRGGQRMLGSTTLHGWIESAWYIQVQEPEEDRVSVILDREFRGAGVYSKTRVTLKMGGYGDPRYSTEVGEVDDTIDDAQAVLDVLSGAADLMNKGTIAKAIGVSRSQVERVIEQLLKDGKIRRRGERYGLPEVQD